MVTKGKVVKVRMGCKACGKIHGSETSNGMPDCNQADTTLYVMTYLDGSLASRTPLPMGLHCQAPLRSGAEEVKDLLVLATGVTPCMLHGDTLGSEKTTNSTLNRCEELNLSVVALPSKPVTCIL